MAEKLLLAIATLLCFGSLHALTCHCLHNEKCNTTDGSCANGCDLGWYGPGCQLGNLAFQKPANQSSTYENYTAANAVNGVMPLLGDDSASDCSHTTESKTDLQWWYVTLSNAEDFVLKNITIVNRQGRNNIALKKFFILYTSRLDDTPNPDTWEVCTFQNQPQYEVVATYTCNTTAIGKRVAIYLNVSYEANFNWKLALCEVYVDGYSYDATSISAPMLLDPTPYCESIAINFATLPIVPPTHLMVNVLYKYKTTGIETQQTFYRSDLRSATVPAVANETYLIWLSSRVCCIGMQCLDKFTSLDDSKCYIRTNITARHWVVTTPQRREYALQKNGNIVNVEAVHLYQCTSEEQIVQCSHVHNGQGILSCTSKVSCELNPRFNHTCSLEVTFNDGFKVTLQTTFHISTANFSTLTLQKRATCESVTLTLESVSSQWDLAPSIIEFYLRSLDSNETQVQRVLSANPGNSSAIFQTASNTSYFAWALPVTYWSQRLVLKELNTPCNESTDCIVGEGTAMKTMSTPQRRYGLQSHACCASIIDISNQPCEAPFVQTLKCSVKDNVVEKLKIHAADSGKVCGLLSNTTYICNHAVLTRNGVRSNDSYLLTTEVDASCLLVDEGNLTGAAVGGTIAGVLLFAAAIALFVVFRRRIRLKFSSDQPDTTVNYIDMQEGIKGTSIVNPSYTFQTSLSLADEECSAYCSIEPEISKNAGDDEGSYNEGSYKSDAYELPVPYEKNTYESISIASTPSASLPYEGLNLNA